MKNYLLPAGIISLIHSAIFLLLSFDTDVVCLCISIFLVITGTVFLSYVSLDMENLYEKRNTLLILGIISLPFSLISAIVILCGYDNVKRTHTKALKTGEIQGEIKQKNKISKETKKIDNLLKIGITMIALAGIMIATTSWEIISDGIKAVLIVLIGFVFMGLYKFSELKLKIRGTTIAYWILSMLSFIIAFLTIGNFALFGQWFSVDGEGANIFMCMFAVFIAITSLFTYKKFNINTFLNVAYIAFILAIYSLVIHFAQEIEMSLLIVSIIITIINLIPNFNKKEIETLKELCIIASFVIFVIFMYVQINYEVTSILIITALIQIVNFAILAVINKNEYINVLAPICIIVLLLIIMGNLDIIGITTILWLSLTIYAMSIVLYFIVKKPMLKKLYLILASISTILAIIANSYDLNIMFSYLILVASFIPVIISKFISKHQHNSSKVFTFLVTLFITFITFVGEDILEIGNIFEGIIVLAIYLFLLLITYKDKVLTVLNIIGIAFVVYFLLNTTDISESLYIILSTLILLVSILSICIFVVKNHKNSNIILAIALPAILSRIVFVGDILIGIYIAILTILMIITGYINKNYYALYIEGIVFTIINVLVQIGMYWGEVPLWVYLLIGGLTLITIVTFKELKKVNQDNAEVINNLESEKVNIITQENNENNN